MAKSREVPAVVIAERDGTVLVENRPARRLLGAGRGELCCDLVGGLDGAEGLPCRDGCVGELVATGAEQARYTRFKLDGQRYHLSCVPVDDVVVCTLSHGTGERPDRWVSVTARERDVLQALADGHTTPSAARLLGMSESTLRTHVEHMRTKLGVNTRAALVALGYRLGFLD